MSTIIRDVKIRVGIEQQRTGGSAGLTESRRATEEATRATQEHVEAIREAGSAHEAFGRTSRKALEHAAHGTIQLARGIALMSASGEEDIKKLVQSFVQIEAAISIIKGGGKLVELAKDFGLVGQATAVLGVAVAAGAVAWRHYTGEVERTAEALKKVREQQDLAAKAERERQHSAEHRARQGQADLTDATSDPQARRKKQDEELKELQRRLDERAPIGKDTERSIRDREFVKRSFEIYAAAEAPYAQTGPLASATGAYHQTLMESHLEEARKAGKAAEEYKEERRRQIEQDIGDNDRIRAIKEAQREDKLEVNRQREQNELANIKANRESESPLAKKRREDANHMFENFQKQAIANGYSMMGYGNAATVWQGSNVNGWEEERTRGAARNEAMKIREEGDSAVQAILQVLNNLKDELAKFESKSDSGKTE